MTDMRFNARPIAIVAFFALATIPCFADSEVDSSDVGEVEEKTYRTEDEYDEEFDRIKEKYADDPLRMKQELRDLDRNRLAELEEQYGDLEQYLADHPEGDVSDEIRGLREYFDSEAELKRLMEDNRIDDLGKWLEDNRDDPRAKEIAELSDFLSNYYDDAGSNAEKENETSEKELDRVPETSKDGGEALKRAGELFSKGFNAKSGDRTGAVMDSLIKQLGKESSWGAAADRIAGKPTPATSTKGKAASSTRNKKGRHSAGTSALLREMESDDDSPVRLSELPENVSQYLDEMTYEELDWSFGGFDGSEAEGSQVMIGGLEMSKNGLSFEYDFDLATWGLEETQYEGGPHGGAIACLFVLDNDGNWVGGKFDWISSSRQMREFANIYGTGPEGVYGGWDLSNVPKSTTAAFVIVSADGKLRSNVITARWDR